MEHHFIKNRDIVLFSFQSWDSELGSNFKEMAIELSKHNRVLFVNRALDRASLWRMKRTPQLNIRLTHIRKGIFPLQTIHSRLRILEPAAIMESINWIPFNRVYDWLNRINNKRLAAEINKAIAQLGFTNVILINDNDFMRGRYLKHYVTCSDYIYYIRDYITGIGYFKRHGARLEQGAMKAADLVAANSAYLAAYAGKSNAASFDIGQGCDIDRYLAPVTAIPADLEPLKKPIIGYAGYLSSWRIDVEIIRHIAQQFPDCSIILIGPVDKLFQTKRLSGLPNLHFLGSKPLSELPAYIYCFDICINPQQLNDITAGNYPRKADEYLAMGKPVVATLTEAMKMFAPYTYLCTSKTDFVHHIKYILNHPQKSMSQAEQARRRAFAATHTWFNSMGKLGDAYNTVKQNAFI